MIPLHFAFWWEKDKQRIGVRAVHLRLGETRRFFFGFFPHVLHIWHFAPAGYGGLGWTEGRLDSWARFGLEGGANTMNPYDEGTVGYGSNCLDEFQTCIETDLELLS